MKRMIAVFLSLLCLAGMLSACGKQEELTLYILPADKISDHLSASALGKLALKEGRIAVKGSDLAGVDWEGQRFALRSDASLSVSVIDPATGGSSLLKSTGEDVFVWVLGKRALYSGGFRKGSANIGQQRYPYIADSERYIFSIVGAAEGNDARFNKSLYQWFYSAGLIKSEL